MGYVLLAALLVAMGWGLKSAFSIPHPDMVTVLVSTATVLVGSLFWVIVTLHALDLVAAFRRSDRAYLVEFGAALRPRMRELLIATPLAIVTLLITYTVVGPAGTLVAALDVPLYALSIAAALSASPTQGATFPRWRMGVALSVIYMVLYGITTGLHAVIATRPALTAAAPWLGVTSAMAAVAAFVSAAKFRASIELARPLGSPVLDHLGGALSGVDSASIKPRDTQGWQGRDPTGRPPRHPPAQHVRRKSRRRH